MSGGDGQPAFERYDEERARRKAALIEAAASGRPDAGALARFMTRYFEHVAAEDVLAWSKDRIVEVAAGHREFAAVRPPGAPAVRVVTVASDPGAGRSAHTVVEIVTDDMPFLVDSVTQALSRRNIAIHLVVHPQFVVRRSLDGRLDEVVGSLDVRQARDGALAESWMHLEVAPQRSVADQESLRRDLMRVLRDVRDAVEDWQRMRGGALQLARSLDAVPPPRIDRHTSAEVAEFLRWMADDHFTFLGYREYRLAEEPSGEPALAAVPGTGLGLLRGDKPHPRLLSSLPAAVRDKVYDRTLLVLTKANSRSTVHRPVYLDYVGVKIFDESGEVVGEQRFLGLFTASAYVGSVLSIPLVRRKAQAVIDRAGFAVHSHSGRDLLQILEDLPRDEIFQTSLPELYRTAIGVLHLQERRQLKLFMRRDVYGRFVSCLVYLPRERYSTKVRLRIQAILLDALGGTSVDDALRVADSVLARVHLVVRVPSLAATDVDADALERRLVAATRGWDDDFADALDSRLGGPSAEVNPALANRYSAAFPEGYKESFSAEVAIDDIEELERLHGDDALGLDLYEPAGATVGELRLKIYRLGEPVSLSDMLPLLHAMGVDVTDERPYRIERNDGGTGGDQAWIYDFGLRQRRPAHPGDRRVRHQRFCEALAAAWHGAAEVDGFQALVLRAGLSWRQVVVLRAYAKYLRQAGSRFSQHYIEAALVSNADVARMLVELFEARLDPIFSGDRDQAQQRIAASVEAALDRVSSLDEDRILRGYLALIRATLRTNHWQRDNGEPKAYLSLKFDPLAVPDLPAPRPKFEIFVYSPRTEGVHLRFGPVARGGIRYSDRREDFRTEILGLAKTQTVKNAVIVPVGSKGGFVVKKMPPDADRDTAAAEVMACYCTLIRGLLDLTDNLVTTAGDGAGGRETTAGDGAGGRETIAGDGAGGHEVVPPPATVRHDGDDPYLVVAADKGTASFSDLANAIAAQYGYWLGDAFASGGSAGYDHKTMGITARGAWESVQRHFRDIGVDCQTTDFTCVGIGDMSGDVFGNGMLLSRHIRLVAAFDHRHIFADPTPEAASSYAERRRLFELPRSTWSDYDASLISTGGGVWPRTAKSIPVSAQLAIALGIEPGAVTPNELVRAILRAPVDLLWNGGIGTYVKASSERHADVGDRSNDAVRVDGRELRAAIVGEGGNLGFTQLGRVEFALAGGHINTDAIDNSAGVDTSDHEVNIKILLDVAARSGRFEAAERGPLLASMTDEVAALVLRDNYAQNLMLACSQAQATETLHIDAAYIDALEKAGQLNRSLEQLPTPEQIAQRRSAGLGLTRPEIAVLLAYSKIITAQRLVASDLSDDIFAQEALVEYFPTPLRERFAADMATHPLLREIIATQLANQLVNYSGATFVATLTGETSAATADIVRAHAATRHVFGVDAVWRDAEALDDVVDSRVQTAMLLRIRQLLDRGTRWFLTNRRQPLDVPETVARFGSRVMGLLDELPAWLRGEAAARFAAAVDELSYARVPSRVARRIASFDEGLAVLSVVEVACRVEADVDEVAEVYFTLGDALQLGALDAVVTALPHDNRWHALARTAARDDLLLAHAELTTDVLLSTPSGIGAEKRIAVWQQANSAVVARTRSVLDDVVTGDGADLAALSVALREVRALVRAASLPSR